MIKKINQLQSNNTMYLNKSPQSPSFQGKATLICKNVKKFPDFVEVIRDESLILILSGVAKSSFVTTLRNFFRLEGRANISCLDTKAANDGLEEVIKKLAEKYKLKFRFDRANEKPF